MSTGNRRVTRHDILQRAQDDAIVKSHVHKWQGGYATFEQAMMECVMDLSHANKRLHDAAVNTAMRESRHG